MSKFFAALTVLLSVLLFSSSALADELTLYPDDTGWYNSWDYYGPSACGGCTSWSHDQCVDFWDDSGCGVYTTVQEFELFGFQDPSDYGMNGDEDINFVELEWLGKSWDVKFFGLTLHYNCVTFAVSNGASAYYGLFSDTHCMDSGWQYKTYSEVFETNPYTSDAWTVEDIDEVEFGLFSRTKLTGSRAGGDVISLRIIVDYDE